MELMLNQMDFTALIASWPGPLHEGLGKASCYIDNIGKRPVRARFFLENIIRWNSYVIES